MTRGFIMEQFSVSSPHALKMLTRLRGIEEDGKYKLARTLTSTTHARTIKFNTKAAFEGDFSYDASKLINKPPLPDGNLAKGVARHVGHGALQSGPVRSNWRPTRCTVEERRAISVLLCFVWMELVKQATLRHMTTNTKPWQQVPPRSTNRTSLVYESWDLFSHSV